MLTGIVKATRAHYAALQHRPSADRVPLDYVVYARAETCIAAVTRGTVHVRALYAGPNSARKREMTRLINRLRAMYPEATEISAEYRDGAARYAR